MNKDNNEQSLNINKKQKHFNNKQRKNEQSFLESISNNNKIIILLDIERTLSNINETNVKIFLNQIHSLQIKFQAKEAIISISTHSDSIDEILPYLNLLNQNLLPNIKIGKAFFLNGTYDYNTEKTTYIEENYNIKKFETFQEVYLKKIPNFFAIIDDNVDTNIISKYKDKIPFVLCCPSKRGLCENNNLMFYNTNTYGIDGVIECLNNYLLNIKDLSKEKILEKQKNTYYQLNCIELYTLVLNKNWEELYNQISADVQNDIDYLNLYDFINYFLEQNKITETDKIYLEKITDKLISLLENKEQLITIQKKKILD